MRTAVPATVPMFSDQDKNTLPEISRDAAPLVRIMMQPPVYESGDCSDRLHRRRSHMAQELTGGARNAAFARLKGWTYDAGRLTERDVKLAEAMDKFAV